jgi:hypothetical protein
MACGQNDIATSHPKIIEQVKETCDDWFTNVTVRWGSEH